MSFLKSITIVLAAILLSACAANVSRHGYRIDQTKQVADCPTPIKLHASFDEKDTQKVGSIEVYDGNLVSKDCDEEIVLGILKNDSCQLGADLINITEETQPDYFFSVCYRVKADFLKFNDPLKAKSVESDPQYEWAKVHERGVISRRKGASAYGMAVGGGMVGGAVGAAAGAVAVGVK